MKETELNKVLNYMKQYVENIYEHDSEPMLNYKDLQLVLEEIERLNKKLEEKDEEIERLHSIIKEVREYIEDNLYPIGNDVNGSDLPYDEAIQPLVEILDKVGEE